MLTVVKQPLVYLITNGALTADNYAQQLFKTLELIAAAAAANVSLVQIREKNISARQLFELAARAAEVTTKSETKLLVNDRADVALAAGASGVHLTAQSISAKIIRQNFPSNFIVGVSCHSLAEVQTACADGADFATFSPIFPTPSKSVYGAAQGIERLSVVCRATENFPVIALGGVNEANFRETLNAGASGVASISFLGDADKLPEIVKQIRNE